MNAANHHGREAACWTVDHFSMAKAIRLRVRTQTHTLSRYTWTEWRSVEPASLLHRHVRWANFVTNSQKFHYGKFAKAFHRDFKIPVFAVEDCWRARWLAAWQAGARKPKKLLATGVAYALMTLPVCLLEATMLFGQIFCATQPRWTALPPSDRLAACRTDALSHWHHVSLTTSRALIESFKQQLLVEFMVAAHKRTHTFPPLTAVIKGASLSPYIMRQLLVHELLF